MLDEMLDRLTRAQRQQMITACHIPSTTRKISLCALRFALCKYDRPGSNVALLMCRT